MKDIYRKAYTDDRNRAQKRGIRFLLTFEEWDAVWQTSGKWLQRGLGRDQYRMARLDKTGPFEVGNVAIWQGSGNPKGRDIPRTRYKEHRIAAGKRGIPFQLTFEEWWGIWQASGKWEQRGRRKGQYVMARFGDKGPYAADNVHICTTSHNLSEGQIGTPLRGWAAPGFAAEYWASDASKEARKRRSEAQRGVSKGRGIPKPDHMRAKLAATITGRRSVYRDGRRTWSYPGDVDYPS